MSDPSAVMTAREAARLFNDAIRPGLAGPPADRDQPVYVGIGGPPGIGKSSAQAAIQLQLGLRDAYVLDGDDLLPHWPGFEAAQQRNTLTAAYLASEATAAGNWWQRAARLLRAQRRDVISTYPMAFPGWDIPRLQEFASFPRSPYRVIAVQVIGPEALSLQGIALRYHAMHQPEQGRFGRWVLPETHDLTLAGTLDSAEAIFQQRAAHELHGMRRDGTLVYSNEAVGGVWRMDLSPRHVFESERTRPLEAQASAEFLQGQGRLRAAAADAPQWAPLVDSIDQRALPVLSHLVLLSDSDLAARLRLMPLIREQAAMAAEVHGVKMALLEQQHTRGDIDQRAGQMLAAGVPAPRAENWRNQAHHDRFAQGLTTGNVIAHVSALQALSDALLCEQKRRRSLAPQVRELEDRGRDSGLWPPSTTLVPLPPAATPIHLRRTSPSDPGPAVNLQPGAAAPTRTWPAAVQAAPTVIPPGPATAPPPPRVRGQSV